MGHGLVTALALPPYDSSSMAFRAAVYAHPDMVRISVLTQAGGFEMRVSGMLPGTELLVLGPAERPWRVLLTCEEAGWYAVSRPPVPPPDGG